MTGGRPLRIAFLFTSGRRARMDSGEPFPSEMFYGALELRDAGMDVTILEEHDLLPVDSWTSTRAAARIGNATATVAGFNALRVAALGLVVSRLNAFDVVVTIATNHALELGMLRRAGLLRARHVAILMGLLPLEANRLGDARIREALAASEIAVISRGERRVLEQRLAREVAYVPFGVDTTFWRPRTGASPEPARYALSVGNDRHRDFELLVRAWSDAMPALRIITSRTIAARHPSVSVIGGDWRNRLLTDEALRDLVQAAEFMVIPLVPTTQPSGQSVALQAMACGIPVVITETVGLWEPDAMRDGVACRLVPAQDERALRAACLELATDAAFRERLGRSGREVVEAEYTVAHMAAAMRRLCESGAGAP